MKTDETEETISEIEDTIYPMYLPSGTYLSWWRKVYQKKMEIE